MVTLSDDFARLYLIAPLVALELALPSSLP
jgi:hypothetical protein